MADPVLAVNYTVIDFLVPAGTTAASPASVAVDLSTTVLREVQLLIPPGHAGVTGLAIEYSGARLLPWDQPNSWIIGDDLNLTFELVFPVSTPLRVKGFNLGVYDHTFHLRIKRDDLGDRVPTSAPVTLVPIA